MSLVLPKRQTTPGRKLNRQGIPILDDKQENGRRSKLSLQDRCLGKREHRRRTKEKPCPLCKYFYVKKKKGDEEEYVYTEPTETPHASLQQCLDDADSRKS